MILKLFFTMLMAFSSALLAHLALAEAEKPYETFYCASNYGLVFSDPDDESFVYKSTRDLISLRKTKEWYPWLYLYISFAEINDLVPGISGLAHLDEFQIREDDCKFDGAKFLCEISDRTHMFAPFTRLNLKTFQGTTELARIYIEKLRINIDSKVSEISFEMEGFSKEAYFIGPYLEYKESRPFSIKRKIGIVDKDHDSCFFDSTRLHD